MKKIIPQSCPVIDNKPLDKARKYFSLKVAGFKTVKKIYPGHFVHAKIVEGVDPFFRRAFSIADYDDKTRTLQIIYKVVGKGTNLMSRMTKGDNINLIGPLGNRFTYPRKSQTAVLVAGGVGLPPLAYLAEQIVRKGHDPQKILFLYGGQSREDLIVLSRLRRLKMKFVPCTDNGSYGFEGFVTQALAGQLANLDRDRTIIYGCGPEPMLAALQDMALDNNLDGELSLEAPMPCGVGVCLGCIKPLLAAPDKYVRVCHDGPVFKIGEVLI